MSEQNPTPEELQADQAAAPLGGETPEGGDAAPGAAEAEAAVAGAEVESAEEAAGPTLEDQLAEARDQHLRAVAELDNVRKRARSQVAAAEAKGVGRLAKELLPALDNLERALAAAEGQNDPEASHLAQGIRLVQQELLGALTRVGIEADSPKGEPFDPHKHEAIAQTPVEGTASGLVVEVYQPGYRYQDTVLRAAKVVVSA